MLVSTFFSGFNEERSIEGTIDAGIQRRHGELIAVTDADGTHPNGNRAERIRLCQGHDMIDRCTS